MTTHRTTSRTRTHVVIALIGVIVGFLIATLVDIGPADASATTTPAPRMTVTPSTTASCYGPGLYGNSTADGTTLTTASVLIAHKSIRLGTRVAIAANGRRVVTRVRDRGPYVGGRTWDVSHGLARALGFSGCSAWGVRRVRVTVLR